jgi:hypothetical protein
MLKFSKSYGQVLFFILSFFVVANCYALTGTVTVKVSPGHQTVKAKTSGSPEVIGTNTAEYEIKAECDPKPGPNEEVKAVEPSWSISSSEKFLSSEGIIPSPNDPGNPSVNISGSNGNWTAKVYSTNTGQWQPNLGQWKITFTVKVVYKLKNSITDEYIYNSDGSIKTQEFTGTGNCRFKSTLGNFRIVLLPDDNFNGRSLSALGVCETGNNFPGYPGKIYVEPIGSTPSSDILPLQDFSSNNEDSFRMKSNLPNGIATFTAGNTRGNAVVTAKDKNGNSETYTIEILEPQKIRMELQNRMINSQNRRFKYKNTYHNKAFYVSISLVAYIEPKEVSFSEIKIGEGVEQYNLEGDDINFFRDNNLSTNHKAWHVPVSSGDISKGCRVLGPNQSNYATGNTLPFDMSGAIKPDTSASGWSTGYGPGKSTITLPWEYYVEGAILEKFDSVDAIKVFDGNRAEITKQSVTGFFNYFPILSLP